ncbi:short-chain dehydrogenase reductase sdr [Alternaria alternata]|nr:short-chain dehydrogenase reductase sdr [Alternaria alternata]
MAPRRWSKRLYRYWKPGRPSPASPVPPPTATLPTVLSSTSPASTAPPSYITVLQPQATPHPLPIYAEFMSPPYTPASTITDTIAPSLRPPSLASSASVYPVPEYSTRRSQSSTSQASEHACSQSQVSSAQPPRSPTSRSPAAQSLAAQSLTVQVSTSESSTSRTTPSQIPTSPNTPSASNVEPPPKQEESGSPNSKSHPPQTLKGKLFVISGATSDVGRATAKLLVASGAKVSLGDTKLIELAQLSSELGPNAGFTTLDVTNERAVKSWLRYAPSN